MNRLSRRDMIQRSAERVLQSKRQPMKAEPKSRPGRVKGRWVRNGSLTLTCYGATKEILADIVREAVEAKANEIDAGESVKLHIQITERRREP
ncbi:MAG: hypothetical protein HYY46_07290 [Deltaproteobacteria bacterium]|nr:hypothetical protein [Deltaproteobacteria bacterium]